jgi:hypothetical protein
VIKRVDVPLAALRDSRLQVQKKASSSEDALAAYIFANITFNKPPFSRA